MRITLKKRYAFLMAMAICAVQILTAQEAPKKDSVALMPGKVLEDFVITGQYEPQSLRNSVYQVKIINRERIKMRGATDITGLLNNETGIRFSTDYTLGETDTKIMGMGGQRVKVLVDGIPVTDRDATKQSLTQIDVNTIERIEIVEGPMSVLYGMDALAGVINIITRKDFRTGWNIMARIQEESIGDSYAPFTNEGSHNENISINWQKKGWQFAAYGTRNNSGGYQDTLAYPVKASKPKDQWLTGATIGFRNSRINAVYKSDYMNETLFSAGAIAVNLYKGFDQYFITHRLNHQLHADWQINNHLKISTAASYQHYKRNTESYTIDYRNSTKTPTDATLEANAGQWDISIFNTWFFRSTAQWMLSPAISLQPGIEIKSDKTSGQRIAGKPQINDYSFFVSSEIKPFAWMNIRPGVRFSKNSIYDAPPVIPSLNTKFTLNKNIDLRASYARGFRAPILRELYFNFHDASHSIEGNPDLKAEYSDSYNVSVSWQNNTVEPVQLRSSLSVFYNKFHDFISMATDDITGVASYFNLSRSKNTGATLENSLNYKDLSVTLGISYIGRYNLYSDEDPLLPSFTWSPEITSNITYRFSMLKAQAGIFYKFNGAMPSYMTNELNEIYLAKQNAWQLADITLSKQLFKQFTLQAGIKNLFDVTRVNNSVQNSGGAHSSGGAMLAGFGRSYFAAILFQLYP